MDVIVLENLFYEKNLSQVFDLKGSERNRMININQQTNKQPEKDVVLLDENFLRCIIEFIHFIFFILLFRASLQILIQNMLD